jgi:hypothetical protein
MHPWRWLPRWIRIWIDTARFGRSGFARRNKEDVAKNLSHAEMLLPMIVEYYNLSLLPHGNQYVLIRP